jgi:hypothetical protein
MSGPVAPTGAAAHLERCRALRMTNNRSLTRPWLPNEEGRLLALFGEGATADEIGEELGRTRQAVYARLQRFRKQRGRASRTSGEFFAQLPE